jgi:hypothetical protein
MIYFTLKKERVLVSDTKGIALVAVIIVMALAAMITLSIASFTANSIYLNTARSAQAAAQGAAQAGVYWAITDYRAGNRWAKVAADSYIIPGFASYKVGKNANFLLVDARYPQVSGNTLQRFTLSNLTQTGTITVNRIVVEWNSGGNLTQIVLNNASRWAGAKTSPADVTLTSQFAMATGTT